MNSIASAGEPKSLNVLPAAANLLPSSPALPTSLNAFPAVMYGRETLFATSKNFWRLAIDASSNVPPAFSVFYAALPSRRSTASATRRSWCLTAS
ncbi:MAG: hypothetical protein KJZ57_14490, partial [Anaerolineales bacterium]|nr:hypothetical protein [Anaerolineales bacterium]